MNAIKFVSADVENVGQCHNLPKIVFQQLLIGCSGIIVVKFGRYVYLGNATMHMITTLKVIAIFLQTVYHSFNFVCERLGKIRCLKWYTAMCSKAKQQTLAILKHLNIFKNMP